MSVSKIQQMDNAIHDEILEYFCQGLRPRPADLQRIVNEYTQGKYDYASVYDAEKSGTESKAEKEPSLPGWG